MRNRYLGTGEPGFHPLRKLRVCLSGLRYAVLYDFSVAWKVIVAVMALGVSFWLREWVDVLLILMATGQMLVAEIFNTTVETVCDYLQPGYDEKIGAIKDIAAAAAGISILTWGVVLAVEFFTFFSKI